MIITILTDNESSWFVKYGEILQQKLIQEGHDVVYVFNKYGIKKGDVCLLLSCTKLIEEEFLRLNKNNIVIHASDLPLGKGFSPLQWQILEGKNKIILTLFEVVRDVDAGPYYFKSTLEYDGTEMLSELRDKMARKINSMALKFINEYFSMKQIKQSGIESFYPRRKKQDDEVDPQKSIVELFNQFRIADNENYPLFFEHLGEEYSIKVEKNKK